MVLERFDDFLGQKPFLDRVILQPVENETVRLTALQSGDLDLIERAPLEWVKEIRAGRVKGVRYVEAPEASWRRIQFNMSIPPFNNALLRRAMAHAIDKKEILNAAFYGFGEPGDQRYPAGHRWYVEGVPPPSFDLNKARELLKAAGYTGQPISIVVEQSQMRETEAAVLQAQLKKIGLNIQLQLMDRAAAVSQVEKGKLAFRFGGGDVTPDPAPAYAGYFLCPQTPEGITLNNLGYCDKEMDKLLAALETELDAEKRKRIVKEIVRKLAQDVPEIPIGSVPRHFALRDYVKGFSTSSDDLLRWSAGGLHYTWLDR
jgi:peptide/nickel transport system substrate-binding protein